MALERATLTGDVEIDSVSYKDVSIETELTRETGNVSYKFTLEPRSCLTFGPFQMPRIKINGERVYVDEVVTDWKFKQVDFKCLNAPGSEGETS